MNITKRKKEFQSKIAKDKEYTLQEAVFFILSNFNRLFI